MHKLIAITGGIGSGKSTLAKSLAQRGYCVWDADIFSRDVLFFPQIQARIKSVFGDSVFLENGILDREFIRNQIFSSPKLKESLEGILHPAIAELLKSKVNAMKECAPSAWVFYEASLILELGRKSSFDACIVVIAEEKIKLNRLSLNRKLSEADALKIMNTQMPDAEKVKFADFVVDNSLTQDKLEKAIDQLINFLRAKIS
ncbi:dephospho-CoA kinase [Fluviispira multicolorata]|uniref:Dephospho-CoA kinase n=1 Tax=Fluviispira multicolorata TaxID=2654512 RepID=A0A833N1H5_9BACT|nr:dephospho-CoA kinase [Fluviispira multicolorata]KAB8030845.1 dephospho-CoA kinase [Fluviispira multicolorata]